MKMLTKAHAAAVPVVAAGFLAPMPKIRLTKEEMVTGSGSPNSRLHLAAVESVSSTNGSPGAGLGGNLAACLVALDNSSGYGRLSIEICLRGNYGSDFRIESRLEVSGK